MFSNKKDFGIGLIAGSILGLVLWTAVFGVYDIVQAPPPPNNVVGMTVLAVRQNRFTGSTSYLMNFAGVGIFWVDVKEWESLRKPPTE